MVRSELTDINGWGLDGVLPMISAAWFGRTNIGGTQMTQTTRPLSGRGADITWHPVGTTWLVRWGNTELWVDRNDIDTILNRFFVDTDKWYPLGAGMDRPMPAGLGAFLRAHLSLEPRYASAIAAIMVAEGLLQCRGSRPIELRKRAVFRLTDDDYFAIQVAANIARRLLREPKTKPDEVIGLGRALKALERLPEVTPGVNVTYGMSYSAGSDGFSETRYIEFRISDWEFDISIGGCVSGPCGSDTVTEPGWHIELSGYRSEGALYDLVEQFDEFLAMGAEITITDDSAEAFQE